MKAENGCEMTLDNYLDIVQYCNDVLETIQKLDIGESFVKGWLLYESCASQISIAKLKQENINEVSFFYSIAVKLCCYCY